MTQRFIPDSVLKQADDLHVQEKAQTLLQSFLQNNAPPPPPEPMPDMSGAFKQLADAYRAPLQAQMAAEQAQQQSQSPFQGILDAAKQGLGMGGGPQPMPTGGNPDKSATIRAAAQAQGVNPDIFDRQLTQEGAYSDDVWQGGRNSSAGARGPGQFMTPTGNSVADQMGIPRDQFWASPELQVQGAAFHMAQLLKANGGDYAKALAAYNAGQGAVDQYGGVPPYPETQTYIKNILGNGGPYVTNDQFSGRGHGFGPQIDVGQQPQQSQADPNNPGMERYGGSAAMLADNAPDTGSATPEAGMAPNRDNPIPLSGSIPNRSVKGYSSIQDALADPAVQSAQYDKWGSDGLSEGDDQVRSGAVYGSTDGAADTGQPSDYLSGSDSFSDSGGSPSQSGSTGPTRDDWRTNPGVTPDPSASIDPGAAGAPGGDALSSPPVEPDKPLPQKIADGLHNLGDMFSQLFGGGDQNPAPEAPQRPATADNFNLPAAEHAAQNAATVLPDATLSGMQAANQGFEQARQAPIDMANMMREGVDAETQRANELTGKWIAGTLTPEEEQEYYKLIGNMGANIAGNGLETEGVKAAQGIARGAGRTVPEMASGVVSGSGRMASGGDAMAQSGRDLINERVSTGRPRGDVDTQAVERFLSEIPEDAPLADLEKARDRLLANARRGPSGGVNPETLAETADRITALISHKTGDVERYYHGSASPFSEVQPSVEGKYGPGGYLTKDPENAEFWGRVQSPDSKTGVNVHAIDVPNNLRILNADNPDDLKIIRADYGGSDVSQAAQNRTLAKMGYDGIEDSDQLLVFPESLKKVRNSFAREKPPNGGVVSGAQDAGQYDRYYHGTGSDFQKLEERYNGQNGLYGDGPSYMTSDPRVAGGIVDDQGNLISRPGYAQKRAAPTNAADYPLEQRIQDAKSSVSYTDDLLKTETDPQRIQELTKSRDGWQARADDLQSQSDAVTSGANIRPIDVPPNLNLLDADKPATPEMIAAIEKHLDDGGWDTSYFDPRNGATGHDVWKELVRTISQGEGFADKDGANDILAALGYDGIKYQGGKRVPLKDAAGAAIQHDVVAIFPDSLQKIRNATAGTPGGLMPRTPAPRGSGQAVDQAMATMGKQALQGGVSGAVGEYQNDPNATPADILKAGAVGAVQRVALGQARSRLGAGGASTLARAIPRVGELYKDPQAPPKPSSGLGVVEDARRAFVTAWTDRNAHLGATQAKAAKEIFNTQGRDLTAAEMAYESTSHNVYFAAKQRIDEQLKPVIQAMGEDHPLLSEALTYLHNVDIAAALGNPNRKFSEGLTAADSQVRFNQLMTQVTPEQRKAILDGIKGVQTFVDGIRDDFVKSGAWTPQFAAEMKQKYPNWVPTRIVTHMGDADVQRGFANGQSVNLRDRGLRRYTLEGTESASEPPLMSLTRYAHEAESVIKRNETFNRYVDLAHEAPNTMPLKPVPADYSPKPGEGVVTGFKNGLKQTYVATTPVAESIKMANGYTVPWFFSALPHLQRELITSTPAFVAGQIPLDSFTALIRDSAREGGPQNAPKVAWNIFKGYIDAFKGIGQGEYKDPDMARMMKAGAGISGYQDRSWGAMQREVDSLSSKGFFEINGVRDVNKLLAQTLGGSLVGGGVGAALPAEDDQQRLEHAAKGVLSGAGIALSRKFTPIIGHRVEMGPRLASARMAEARALRGGANPATAEMKAVDAFRNVTLDFEKGGTWAKVINQVVPFFNVGWQSAATISRAMKENPAAFPITAASLIGGPTVAAEAWNNADPQRMQDYADVPNYVKDRGIVIMHPGEAPIDKDGNRKPSYTIIPMREMAPIVQMTREAMRDGMKMTGQNTQDPRGWEALLGGAITAVSPIQANSPADLFSSVLPAGADTGLQLATNRDYFRGRDIATDRNDESATAISKAVAGGVNALGGSVRPSQIEFGARSIGGNQAGMVLGAGDIAAGKGADTSAVQDQPVIGGVARRFVGSAGGQQLQDARDAMLTPEIRNITRQAGLRDEEVVGVPSQYQKAPLTRDEQGRWQRTMNVYLLDEITMAQNKAGWDDPAKREQLVRDAISQAKLHAAKDALGFTATDIKDRRAAAGAH